MNCDAWVLVDSKLEPGNKVDMPCPEPATETVTTNSSQKLKMRMCAEHAEYCVGTGQVSR
jgi:hypothetical protein